MHHPKIDGSIGLLGEDYHGYPVQDTHALRELLIKAENNPDFVQLLTQQFDQK